MAEFVTPAMVRDYLQANATTGQWSNSLIGSNIAAASADLQRWTHRQFEANSNTAVIKRFTTNGAAYLPIPDLRSASSVQLQGVALEADSTYYLIPDPMNTGVNLGIQFRSFGTSDYRSNPEWFDRNLDSPRWQARSGAWSLPNDLAIAGYWGHVPLPDPLLHATTALAGYYVLRSDALLSGAINRLEQGTIFDLSQLPIEVRRFVEDWKVGPSLVAT
jgi:hypothetical protein